EARHGWESPGRGLRPRLLRLFGRRRFARARRRVAQRRGRRYGGNECCTARPSSAPRGRAADRESGVRARSSCLDAANTLRARALMNESRIREPVLLRFTPFIRQRRDERSSENESSPRGAVPLGFPCQRKPKKEEMTCCTIPAITVRKAITLRHRK